ncbi:MAG: phosphoribosylaminoimidazolesuccinocarboxamide synthase, partial [Chloroflexi bacterium]|nr:phosphoribosylaminoimidazolesuccinocarboxamide synthase [Chloroflexota bacterium]
SIVLYSYARDFATERGIIIADTKFEFGTVEGELTLIDEVLTPDSSRFWDADGYAPGKSQPNYDKQFVRDWLDEQGWDHEPPAPELPPEVVAKTHQRYLEAYRKLTGEGLA